MGVRPSTSLALLVAVTACVDSTEPLGLAGRDGARLVAERFEVGGVLAFGGMYDTVLEVACNPHPSSSGERCLPWITGEVAYFSPDCTGPWVFLGSSYAEEMLPTRSDGWGTVVEVLPDSVEVRGARLGARIEQDVAAYIWSTPLNAPFGCHQTSTPPGALREVVEVVEPEAFVAVERTAVSIPDGSASVFEAEDGASWAYVSTDTAPQLTEGEVRIRSLEEAPEIAAMQPFVWAPVGPYYELFEVDELGPCNPREFRGQLRCVPRNFGSAAWGNFADPDCSEPKIVYSLDGEGMISRVDPQSFGFEIYEAAERASVFIARDGACLHGADGYELGPLIRSGTIPPAERIIDR